MTAATRSSPDPARSWLARLGSITLRSLLVVFVLLLIALVIVYWLIGTDSGFARLSNLANDRVAGLSIEGASGNLGSGVNAQRISFANDSMDIKASDLTTQWTMSCLFRKRFCLDDVHVDTLDITLSASEPAPPAPTRTEPLTLPDITLPIAVDISDVTLGTVRVQPPGDAPAQVINDIQLSASAEGSAVSIDTLALDYQSAGDQSISALLQGTIELDGLYPLDLSLRVSSDDVLPDTLPEGSGDQALLIETSLSNTLSDLAIDTRISGIVQVMVDARLQPLDPSLPATLSIVSDELGWPVQSRSQIAASDVRIDASGDMNDYTFSIGSTLAGEQVPETQIKVQGLANTERLTLPSIDINTLGGSANGRALLALTQPMVWSTRWDIADIDPSLQVPDLTGQLGGRFRANGSVQQGQWSLKLDEAVVDGELRGLPFRLDGKLSKGLNDLWFVEHITLNNDKNQIKAQGVVGETVGIKADINLPQLQNLLPGLAGGFDARLSVDGALGSPDIVLDANADVIRYDDILVRSLAVNGDVDQLFVDTSTLDISVNTIRLGENTISNTALSLTGKRDDHQLTLQASGPQSTDLSLVVNGALTDTFDWSGELNKVLASLPAHKVVLAEPAAIQWRNDRQQASVSPHCWLISDASTLCLEDEFSTDAQGSARLSLKDYALSQLNDFLPDNSTVAGMLAADVDLSWGDGSASDRQAVVTATIDNASVQTVDALDEPVSFGYDTIALNASLTPADVNASLSLSSPTLGSADIQVQLDPSNPESVIDGSVALQGLSLAIAESFLLDFDKVDGTLSAQGKLAGTLVAPEYNGVVVLDSPILQAEILPLPVTGGRITANIAGQNMTLNGDILSDDGSIEVYGRGVLDPQKWNADIRLTGKQLNIQSDPVQQATVNHDIRIVANPRRLSVTGSVDIPMAVIDVAELPEGASTVSSDVVIIEDIEQESAPAVVATSDLELAVLVDVLLGDDVSLSAYGLEANLTGDMDVRIRGNKPPQLGGEIRVVDGIYKQYGQDLEANGQILFVGPIDSTRLDIDAVREIDNEDRIAGLRIQGTVAKPEITLFTDPSDKSQDAILSYVVLGRDINEANDQEADLLATAALALAVKGGRTVGDDVASKLGVEEFGLETRGSGDDTELVVSGRLNDRLLLRYGRGVFDAESTLYLRYDLTRKLYLEAAQGAQDAVDLFYSFSF